MPQSSGSWNTEKLQETIVVTSRFKQVLSIQWTKTSCGLIWWNSAHLRVRPQIWTQSYLKFTERSFLSRLSGLTSVWQSLRSTKIRRYKWQTMHIYIYTHNTLVVFGWIFAPTICFQRYESLASKNNADVLILWACAEKLFWLGPAVLQDLLSGI